MVTGTSAADCQNRRVEVLVRVPHVEREALQILEGLDRLQALRSGEFVEGRPTLRLVLIVDPLLGHVTSLDRRFNQSARRRHR